MAIEIKTVDKKKIELQNLIEKIAKADPFESVELSGQLSPLLQAIKKEETKVLRQGLEKPKKLVLTGPARITKIPAAKFYAVRKGASKKAFRPKVSPKRIATKKI